MGLVWLGVCKRARFWVVVRRGPRERGGLRLRGTKGREGAEERRGVDCRPASKVTRSRDDIPCALLCGSIKTHRSTPQGGCETEHTQKQQRARRRRRKCLRLRLLLLRPPRGEHHAARRAAAVFRSATQTPHKDSPASLPAAHVTLRLALKRAWRAGAATCGAWERRGEKCAWWATQHHKARGEDRSAAPFSQETPLSMPRRHALDSPHWQQR